MVRGKGMAGHKTLMDKEAEKEAVTVRPAGYQYLKIVKDLLNNDLSRVFNGDMIYPRQLEVHLPGNKRMRCNFDCAYCQGNELDMSLSGWEQKGLTLIEKLKGAIPYHIYGGAYTEPMLNSYFLDYLKLTKKYNNNFGIHSNGSLMYALEKKINLLSTIVEIADSPKDYCSVSLDGGTPESHSKVKNVKKDFFTDIIKGIDLLVKLRGNKKFPTIRVAYLMTKENCSPEEIAGICKIMRDIKVDSLRFSVPYANYGRSFDEVKKYRNDYEVPFGDYCANVVAPHISKSHDEKPYIFWHPPEFQDVTKMNFKQCIYSYYQITFGADGHVFKCSSTASPSFDKNILGVVTDDLGEFQKMVVDNHNPDWEAKTCFCAGARCNRIALEINTAWANKTL